MLGSSGAGGKKPMSRKKATGLSAQGVAGMTVEKGDGQFEEVQHQDGKVRSQFITTHVIHMVSVLYVIYPEWTGCRCREFGERRRIVSGSSTSGWKGRLSLYYFPKRLIIIPNIPWMDRVLEVRLWETGSLKKYIIRIEGKLSQYFLLYRLRIWSDIPWVDRVWRAWLWRKMDSLWK